MKSIKLLAALLIGTALTTATFAAPAFASRQSDQMTILATQMLQQQQLQQQAYLYGQVPTVTVGNPYYNGYGVPAQTVYTGYAVPTQTVNGWQPTLGGNGVPAQTVPPSGYGWGSSHFEHSRHDHR